MTQPLDGITVLDLTHALAGPFCTQQLALLGATVIKIERPGSGDDFRDFVPATFEAVNSGKQSVTLNLRQAGALAVLERLVRSADVMVDNFRPGDAVRFGIEWSLLQRWNPRLTWCSISGFGLDGPWHDLPAVEWTVQARSGLTASYIPDSADPRDPGLGVLDIGSGQAAVTAILAALLQRAATGAGQRIDVAMLDVAMNLSCTRINSAATKRRLRPAVGRFRAADRAIFLMGAHQRWFRTLCSVLGPPDLGEDPRFADEAAREANANALLDELNARLAARPAAEWEALFLQAGLPAAVVRSLQEVLDSTAIRQRGQVLPGRVSGSERSIRVVAPPFKLPEQARPLPAPVPAIGEHTDAVLQRLGFAADEIAAFRAEGLV